MSSSDSTYDRVQLARGYVVALASAVILSTTAIFIRYLTQTYQMPALVLAFWRDGIVALTLALVLARFFPRLMRIRPGMLGFLITFGFVLAVFNASWTLSVALNGAAVSTVLAYSSAGFTALLGWWLLKERLDWGKFLAIILSLVGCILVAGALDLSVWRVNTLGILVGVFSGLLYAIYSLMGRSASQRGLNPWTTLLYTFCFATVYLFIFNLWSKGTLPGAARNPGDFFWLGNALEGWGILLILAAGPTLAGFGLYNVSLSYLPSSVANLIVTLEPAFTAAIAYFLLGERLNGTQIVGSVMILLGVLFLRVYEGRFLEQ